MRVNGKNWHAPRGPLCSAFKSVHGKSTSSNYAQRMTMTQSLAATKSKEREMKEGKQLARQQHIQTITERRAKKEEKERYEKLQEKMHRKRVERLKKREKRNKLLNS